MLGGVPLNWICGSAVWILYSSSSLTRPSVPARILPLCVFLGFFPRNHVPLFQVVLSCQFHFSCNGPSSCPSMPRGRSSLLFQWLLHHSRIEILDPPTRSAVACRSTYFSQLKATPLSFLFLPFQVASTG